MARIENPPMISLAEHPRAAVGIRRAKAFGGLVAFATTAFGSHLSGMSIDAALLRALGAGLAAYFVTWGIALSIWRAFVRAETKLAVERLVARRAEQQARLREFAAGHSSSYEQ